MGKPLGYGMRLVALDPDWLEESLARGHVEIAHNWVDGHLILTAPTRELQDLVQAVAGDPAAFPSDTNNSLIIDLRRALG